MLPEEQAFYLMIISVVVGGSTIMFFKSIAGLVTNVKTHGREKDRVRFIRNIIIFGIPFLAFLFVAILAGITAIKNGRIQ